MTWIELRLAELVEEGYFDDLPGAGRPIRDLDIIYSPTWWAARWVERDAARQELAEMTPRLEADIAAALTLPRDQARERLTAISRAIVDLNRLLDSCQQLPDLDVDTVLIRGRWEQ